MRGKKKQTDRERKRDYHTNESRTLRDKKSLQACYAQSPGNPSAHKAFVNTGFILVLRGETLKDAKEILPRMCFNGMSAGQMHYKVPI